MQQATAIRIVPQNLPPETWRPAPGFESDYLISDRGRISSTEGRVRQRTGFTRRRPPKILSMCDDGRGYWQAVLSVDGRDFHVRPHRLVALAFVGPEPFPGAEVNHIDFDTRNNVPSNLEWATRLENVTHSAEAKHFCPFENPNNRIKLSPADIAAIRVLLAEGSLTQKQIAGRFSVDQSMVSRVKRNLRWKE
jgi:hypothetical protein